MIFNIFESKQKQFMNAIKKGKYEDVVRLIEHPEVDVNKGSYLPLHVVAPDRSDNWTPLHVAAGQRQERKWTDAAACCCYKWTSRDV